MGKVQDRRKYTKEFKMDAVRHVETSEKTVPEVAKALGINPDLLYKWRRELLKSGTDSFPGKGKLSKKEEEKRRVSRKIADLEMENEILKKAIGIFSQGRK